MIEHLDEKLSTELFKSLTSGKIINKKHMKDNLLKINPLYIELSENENTYIELYKKIGYELKVKSDYYYLASIGDGSSDGVRTKIITTLLVLFRYVSHDKGYSVDYLMNDAYGITKEDLEYLNGSKYMTGIKLAEGKSVSENLQLLTERGITYKTNRGHYVLTEAGCDFFNEYLNGMQKDIPFSLGDDDDDE